MKQILITLSGILILSWASCKKGYTCACSSDSGFYDGFDIHETKRRADKKCKEYYKSNYENRLPDSTQNIGTVYCELHKNE
jgi:hypothetical protein